MTEDGGLITDGGRLTDFSYYPDGQLAERHNKDSEESFIWDGLSLIKRNSVNYTIEPHVNGGSPILTTENTDHTEVLFNDILGSSLGTVKDGSFSEIDRTSFGQTDNCPLITDDFYTGKPAVPELGYTFLFRNYRPELGKWQTSDPLEYLDGWNKLAYVKNRVTSYIDFLGAWAEDVHYTMTNTWVQNTGFPLEQADRIATANTGTDSLWTGTGPWGEHIADSPRHFDYNDDPYIDSREVYADTEFEEAVNAWNEGRVNEALDAIGRGLHSLQDIDAHRDWDPRSGYDFVPDWSAHPSWYDDVSDERNRDALANTVARTRTYINDFRRAVGLPIAE